MATIPSAASGNWSSGATWFGGSVPGAGDTASIGAHTIILDTPTITVGNITFTSGSAVLSIPASATRTINTGTITAANAARAAATCVVATGQALIINGAISHVVPSFATGNPLFNVTGGSMTVNAGSSAAQAIFHQCQGVAITISGGTYTQTGYTASSGSISNGTPAITFTGGVGTFSGGFTSANAQSQFLSASSNASVTINGDVLSSMTGANCLAVSGSATVTLNGYLFAAAGATNQTALQLSGSAIFNLNGNLRNASGVLPILMSGGTLNWTGSRSLAVGEECGFSLSGGTLNLSNLALSNSGKLAIYRTGSAGITTTNCVITNQTSSAQAAILGGSATVINVSSTAVFPSAPSKVHIGEVYGFVGALISGTASAFEVTGDELAEALLEKELDEYDDPTTFGGKLNLVQAPKNVAVEPVDQRIEISVKDVKAG